MIHTDGHFNGVRNAVIYQQAWLPEHNVKAAMIIVHGLGEHSGRYGNVVDQFVPRGIAVYSFDHLGHGKSDGGREQIEEFNDFLGTLAIYVREVKKLQPGKPLFLFGHSMGGLISCTYLLDHQEEFTGAIISAAPVSVPANISPFTILLGKVFSAIAPTAGVLPLDANGVSRDPAVVAAYKNDALVFHGKTPARLAAEMLKAMARVNAEAGRITLPIFIYQGTADSLVDPDNARVLFEKVSSSDKTLKNLENFFHESHNDPERAILFQELVNWLEAHCK